MRHNWKELALSGPEIFATLIVFICACVCALIAIKDYHFIIHHMITYIILYVQTIHSLPDWEQDANIFTTLAQVFFRSESSNM